MTVWNSKSEEDGRDNGQPHPAGTAGYLLLYLKGIAMGLGDSVPGVSGGTIAVITRIYDTLIYSISSVDVRALRLLVSRQWQACWRHINGNFLLVLALGILSGLLVSARSVLFLLDNYFEVLMAFFIGLVLASSWLLRHQFRLSRPLNLLALAIGIVITASVSLLEPVSAGDSLLYFFLCGAIAICAMILPGLSGAFILLLLGAYEAALTALVDLQWSIILVFAGGCVLGLLAFSRVLAWLLKHYHELCYGFITGLLLGSVMVLWPWQQAVTFYTDSDGAAHPLRTINVWPTDYLGLTGNEPAIALAVVALIAGAALVLGLERAFHRSGQAAP